MEKCYVGEKTDQNPHRNDLNSEIRRFIELSRSMYRLYFGWLRTLYMSF